MAHVLAYIRFPPFYNIPILREAQLTVIPSQYDQPISSRIYCTGCGAEYSYDSDDVERGTNA